MLNQLRRTGHRRRRTDAVCVGFAENLLMATLDTDPDQVARPGTVDEANFKYGLTLRIAATAAQGGPNLTQREADEPPEGAR